MIVLSEYFKIDILSKRKNRRTHFQNNNKYCKIINNDKQNKFSGTNFPWNKNQRKTKDYFDCENSYIYYLKKVFLLFFLETCFFVQQGSCNNRKKIAFSSELFDSRWYHGNTC